MLFSRIFACDFMVVDGGLLVVDGGFTCGY